MISFPNKQKKPYACLDAETGKPYDFCLLYLSAVSMIAQGSGEVNENTIHLQNPQMLQQDLASQQDKDHTSGQLGF